MEKKAGGKENKKEEMSENLCKSNLSHDGMTVSFFKTLEPPTTVKIMVGRRCTDEVYKSSI